MAALDLPPDSGRTPEHAQAGHEALSAATDTDRLLSAISGLSRQIAQLEHNLAASEQRLHERICAVEAKLNCFTTGGGIKRKRPAHAPRTTMHITVQPGRRLPPLSRCNTCCSDYHCPFCSSTSFRPKQLSRLRVHMECHFNRSVTHEGYTIHRCGLGCRKQLHYHCPYCKGTICRKEDFTQHLLLCENKSSGTPTTNKQIVVLRTSTTSAPASSSIPIPATSTTPIPASSTIPSPASSTTTIPASSTRPVLASSAIPTPASSTLPVPGSSTIPVPPPSIIPFPASFYTLVPASSTTPVPSTSITHQKAPPTFTEGESKCEQIKRIHKKTVVKRKCPICHLIVNRKNLKKHVERQHTSQYEDMTAIFHFNSGADDAVHLTSVEIAQD